MQVLVQIAQFAHWRMHFALQIALRRVQMARFPEAESRAGSLMLTPMVLEILAERDARDRVGRVNHRLASWRVRP